LNPDEGLVVFDARGTFGLFTLLEVAGSRGEVRHRSRSPAPAFNAGAFVARVEARTYYFDRDASQLRRYDTDQSDAVLIDGVADFRVDYWGDAGSTTGVLPAPGESTCLVDSDGAPRMTQTLPIASDGLAELPTALLVDGPWCGEGDSAFDVDLMRVRRVRFTLASLPASRSHAPGPFRIVVDVAPRNLQVDF
jgi:hypothetical protein